MTRGVAGRCGPRSSGGAPVDGLCVCAGKHRKRSQASPLHCARMWKNKLPKADLDWPVLCRRPQVACALVCWRLGCVGQGAGGATAFRCTDEFTPIGHCFGARSDGSLAGPTSTYTRRRPLSPPCVDVLTLRDTLGLRSCSNTRFCGCGNPSGAQATVQKACFTLRPQPSSPKPRSFWRRRNMSIIKGGGGGNSQRHTLPRTSLCSVLREGAPIFKQGRGADLGRHTPPARSSEPPNRPALPFGTGGRQSLLPVARLRGTAPLRFGTLQSGSPTT